MQNYEWLCCFAQYMYREQYFISPYDDDNDWQDDMFNQVIDHNDEEIANRVNPELAAGRQLRRRLIRTFFG